MRLLRPRPAVCAAAFLSRCGYPYDEEGEDGRLCPPCVERSPALLGGTTAVVRRGPARALLHTLKYHGGRYVLGDIATILRQAPWALERVKGSCLVPVPLRPRRQRERDGNQSSWLADPPRPIGLDRRDRQTNLKNAFALRPGPGFATHLRYTLVDDVFTTGSTLHHCALLLRRAGALNLHSFTFGRR